jgi:hypothetical protein
MVVVLEREMERGMEVSLPLWRLLRFERTLGFQLCETYSCCIAGGTNDNGSSSSSSKLSTATIAGIASGSVVALAAIIGAVFKYLSWRDKNKKKPTDGESGGGGGGGGSGAAGGNSLEMVLHRPAFPPAAFEGDANASGEYIVTEVSWKGYRKAKFKVDRQPTPTPATRFVTGPGRVVEDLD